MAAAKTTLEYMQIEGKRWAKSLLNTPKLIYNNAFKVESYEEHVKDEEQTADLKRTLTPLDLVMLGIGADVFYTTGPIKYLFPLRILPGKIVCPAGKSRVDAVCLRGKP